MKRYYIYILRNLINNKIYVGKTTVGLEKRFESHISRFKSLKYNHLHLYSAMNKYGINNFRIESLEIVSPNKNLLKDREEYWIRKKQSYLRHIGYNLSVETTHGFEMIDEKAFDEKNKKMRITHSINKKQYGFFGIIPQKNSWRINVKTKLYHYSTTLPTKESAAYFRDKLVFLIFKENHIFNFPEKINEHTENNLDEIKEKIEIFRKEVKSKKIKIKHKKPKTNLIISIYKQKILQKYSFIRENYSLYGAKYCANYLNISTDNVRHIAKKINVNSKNMLHKWNNDEIDFLIKNYEKMSYEKISQIIKKTKKAVGLKIYRIKKIHLLIKMIACYLSPKFSSFLLRS